MRISDWSSDVCSSDLAVILRRIARRQRQRRATEQRGRKDLFRHIPLLRLCLTLTSSLRRKGAGCKKISCRGRRGFWFTRRYGENKKPFALSLSKGCSVLDRKSTRLNSSH